MNDSESNQKDAHTQTPDFQSHCEDKKLDVRTSQLAVFSCTFGIFALLGTIVVVFSENFDPALVLAVAAFVLGMLALVLGVMSLGRIGKGKGMLTGRGFAAIGITIPLGLFFFAVLIPALERIRPISTRLYCGTNLSGIGKAMLIYALDFDDEFPRAAGPNSTWGSTSDFQAGTAAEAYGLNEGSGHATISANFFLLVKYADVTPESFLCKGEPKTTEFKLSDYKISGKEIVALWDFGPDPSKHCSFSYHIPYGPHTLTSSSDPGMALAADRNPWLDAPACRAKRVTDLTFLDPDGPKELVRRANSISHKGDGQNVLYVDGHTAFERTSTCGIDGDNIYTLQNAADIKKGIPPTRESQPANVSDSLLVHDPPRGTGR